MTPLVCETCQMYSFNKSNRSHHINPRIVAAGLSGMASVVQVTIASVLLRRDSLSPAKESEPRTTG